jgi:hypothetical protein
MDIGYFTAINSVAHCEMRHVSRSLFLFVFACVRQVPSFVLPYVRSARSSSKAPQISTTSLNLVQDLNVVGLVAGQENYGLAVVCVGEALWSFVQVPSLSHAKILVPAAIAALVLVVVSGPMITSGDVASVSTGLWIATAVSVGLGVSYIARLLAPFSPSPKEIAALGLLVAIAGFFSFAQNLVVDGFVSLPSLPSLPSIEFPEINFDLDGSVSLPPIQTIDDPIISSVVDYVPPSVEASPQ